jgi:translation initiation factor 5B
VKKDEEPAPNPVISNKKKGGISALKALMEEKKRIEEEAKRREEEERKRIEEEERRAEEEERRKEEEKKRRKEKEKVKPISTFAPLIVLTICCNRPSVSWPRRKDAF